MYMKYIYLLIDPATNEIRYVGQTCRKLKKRLSQHVHDVSDTHKSRWIKKLKRFGYTPLIKVVQFFENISDKDLNNAEVYWIRHFKELGNNLTNSTDGGNGTIGYVAPKEVYRKVSESLKGKKKSKETKRKIALTLKGRNISEETKRKISLSSKGKKRSLGRKHSEETKQKMSKSKIGKKHTEEHIKNNRLAQLARFLKK